MSRFLVASALASVVFGVLIMAAGSRPAFAAAVPSAGTGSCHQPTTITPDETYCSWDGSGTAPVIGNNSCTAPGSCTDLGQGTVIGYNSCTVADACDSTGGGTTIGDNSCDATYSCQETNASVGEGSCLGKSACQEAGDSGEAHIGNGSCLSLAGQDACYQAGGVSGFFSAGDGSCVGNRACDLAGEGGGDVEVGDESCVGEFACYFAANDAFGSANGGRATIGNSSCRGEEACIYAASNPNQGYVPGEFEAGDNSCNGKEACEAAGSDEGSAVIGNGSCTGTLACLARGQGNGQFTAADVSCNGNEACYSARFGDSFTVGTYSCNTHTYTECDASVSTIGDCVYNDEAPPQCLSSVEVRELLLPWFDSGRFNLLLDNEVLASNVGNNGTTGPVEAIGGQAHMVSEQGAGNTALSSYRTTVVCYDSHGGFLAYGFSPSLTLEVAPAQHVTCTFINQRVFSWFWWR